MRSSAVSEAPQVGDEPLDHLPAESRADADALPDEARIDGCAADPGSDEERNGVDPAARGQVVDVSPGQPSRPTSWVDRVEAFLSRLSTRDNFWHRIFSLLFLPLAFWSGIKMRKTGEGEVGDAGGSFAAILPFRKFNKNWYNAMAGASLLANTEIAGGMYVFGEAGGDYTVVCKNLNYTFLRPCYGPAVYRADPKQDLKALIATGGEFNITLEMDIRQLGVKPGQRELRVGRAEITFHVTPKLHAKVRQKKLKQRDRQRAALKRGD